MKWNGNNIVDCLKIYEQHPVLWNIKHKDYRNTTLKDELFKQLYEQLAANGLIERMEEKQLKSKIKTIEDVYRQELAKIEKNPKKWRQSRSLFTKTGVVQLSTFFPGGFVYKK
jgi:alpha-galactosidase